MEELIIKLQELARLSPKYEICGIISSSNSIYKISNVSKHPMNQFIFDKREYFTCLNNLKNTGETVSYIFHSHPAGDPTPSKADLQFCKTSGIPQIIVSDKKYRVVTHA